MVRLTVVNDSPELLDLFHDVLAGDGYETTSIEHVNEGLLAKIRASEPDLLMIDLRHGGNDRHGWQVVQELRATPGCEHVPVLLCTADLSALEDPRPTPESMTSVALLRLPFEIDSLLRTIHTLTDKQETLRCS